MSLTGLSVQLFQRLHSELNLFGALCKKPECRAVRDRTEKPQDEHGAMPPAPGYPKYVYGHSATGPRVMNPAFHFVPTAFFPRRARLLHVHFSTRQSMYVGRARLCDNSRARLPLPCT